MKPELYSRVVVNRDILAEDLHRGDVATVIEYLKHPDGGEDRGYPGNLQRIG